MFSLWVIFSLGIAFVIEYTANSSKKNLELEQNKETSCSTNSSNSSRTLTLVYNKKITTTSRDVCGLKPERFLVIDLKQMSPFYSQYNRIAIPYSINDIVDMEGSYDRNNHSWSLQIRTNSIIYSVEFTHDFFNMVKNISFKIGEYKLAYLQKNSPFEQYEISGDVDILYLKVCDISGDNVYIMQTLHGAIQVALDSDNMEITRARAIA